MKNSFLIPLITLVFYCNITVGQHVAITKLSHEICQELDSVKSVHPIDISTIRTVVLSSIFKDTVALKKDLPDSSSSNTIAYGQKLGALINIALIQNCASYFEFMDSVRYIGFKNLNQDSVNRELTKVNIIDSSISGSGQAFYLARGILHFQLNAYTEAIKDFNNLLQINPNHPIGLLMMGWSLEITKHYQEALSFYDKAEKITHSPRILVYSEICKRKMLN